MIKYTILKGTWVFELIIGPEFLYSEATNKIHRNFIPHRTVVDWTFGELDVLDVCQHVKGCAEAGPYWFIRLPNDGQCFVRWVYIVDERMISYGN